MTDFEPASFAQLHPAFARATGHLVSAMTLIILGSGPVIGLTMPSGPWQELAGIMFGSGLLLSMIASHTSRKAR